MDRFVVREPRVGADFPQGNPIFGFGSNLPRSNCMIPPENVYLGGYGREFPMQNLSSPGYFGVPQQINSPSYAQQSMNINVHQNQPNQMMSGIDPRYLAAYSDGNAQFIATGQNMQNERSAPVNFGSDYENRSIAAPDRSKPQSSKTIPPQAIPEPKKMEIKENNIYYNTPITTNVNIVKKENFGFGFQKQQSTLNVSTKSSEPSMKEEHKIVSRSDKLKALYKTGTRVFSGPIEKVLKWHKALQEIGVMVIYEIVAKCVSVRPGDSCAKNLVVRDDGGPAMQVVYYEIDFMLPEIKPPCTVRVVGRMMAGTCRLQAFNVRPATGDDVSTLPRRAAVASHHVGKLCKEYGIHV